MAWDVRGLIEGFYGRPWTWDERVAVMAHGHARGLRDYVYAPKDDPLHRARWRESYGAEHLAGFAALVDAGTLRVGFALSPGLDIDYDDPGDRAALASKVDQVIDLGIGVICLALDDIPVRSGLGHDHAALTTWLHDHLDGRAELLLVPTEYTGSRSTPYLDALAAGVPEDVPIAWTGETVVCDEITRAQAEARAAALGGRPPLIWDNYPVNDALMGDTLSLGPLRGREASLGLACSGYLANPMVQPHSSLPALASIAGYLQGEDPQAVWEKEIGELRPLAEACDGVHPRELVAALTRAEGGPGWPSALAALRAWLKEVAGCTAPGLEDEADDWVQQARAEAGVALHCVRSLEQLRATGPRADQEPDLAGATERTMAMVALWQLARRGRPAVMGPRCGFRPVIAQGDDGGWRFERASVVTGANAVDQLAEYTLDVLAAEAARS